MADIFVKNSLNPYKSVKFNVSIKKFFAHEFEGEAKYYIEVGTTHSGIYNDENTTYSGSNYVHIRPGYLDRITEEELDGELSKIVGKLSSFIDWGTLLTDLKAPYVSYMEPVGRDVSIYSNVMFNIKDDVPSAGVDLSDMLVTLDNGETVFDITSEVEVYGDPFEYSILWSPKIRVI